MTTHVQKYSARRRGARTAGGRARWRTTTSSRSTRTGCSTTSWSHTSPASRSTAPSGATRSSHPTCTSSSKTDFGEPRTTTTSRSCSWSGPDPTSAPATTSVACRSSAPASRRGRSCRRPPRIANARRLHRHLTNWLEFPKTVIAVCQGTTLGAGFNLVLAADLVIAGEGATFGRPQARIGFAGFSTAMPLVLLKLGVEPWLRSDDHGTTDHGRGDAAVGCRLVDRSRGGPRGRGDAVRARRSRITRPTG